MPGKPRKCSDAIYKDVVVIGNGPSGITLSYLLSGHVPYYNGERESPDEFLHLRMSEKQNEPLVLQDLEFLSDGLEGRSTNPVSILFDALSHPDADIGHELPSLLEWKIRTDLAVDHVVLGRGNPGGAWQMMSDSNLLTVSLGTWMELPNMSMIDWRPKLRDKVEHRVSVSTVAQYYQEYVEQMSLGPHFEDFKVTSVRKITDCNEVNNVTKIKKKTTFANASEYNAVFQQESLYNEQNEALGSTEDEEDDFSSCNDGGSSGSEAGGAAASSSYEEAARVDVISRNCLSATRAGQFFRSQARRRANTTCCLDEVCKSGNSEEMRCDLSWNPIVFSCGTTPMATSVASSIVPTGRSYSWSSRDRPPRTTACPISKCFNIPYLWEVSGIKTTSNGLQEPVTYLAKNVVLATGSYDKPNSLDVPGEDMPFVVHSLHEMVDAVKNLNNDDPIMIVGAGLSAADAIEAAMSRGLTVLHIFRRSPDDKRLILKNLPTVIYPEYHQIHKLMGGSVGHKHYRPYPQCHVVRIDSDHTVSLHSASSDLEKVKVSLIVVLIGASPNLDFLEDEGRELGIIPDETISRNNPVDIDLFSHESVRQSGIYALGPLVGDNFVRFLQGGALAITSHILKKRKQKNS